MQFSASIEKEISFLFSDLRIRRQHSSESMSSINSTASHSSMGSLGKDAEDKKKKKKSWVSLGHPRRCYKCQCPKTDQTEEMLLANSAFCVDDCFLPRRQAVIYFMLSLLIIVCRRIILSILVKFRPINTEDLQQKD